MIAAAQLRPGVCAAVVAPTVVAFFATSAAARVPNGDEPWSAIVLGTFALAGVGLGAVLLSSVQRSRVLDIGALATDRARLLGELVQVEERERRTLAESLHDGALQYVLAARQELADLGSDPTAAARVGEALTEASTLLRSTTADLHPAVLQQLGLAAALRELAATVGARGGLVTSVDVEGWPEGVRSPADPLLLATARELLTNVTKHARAGRASVVLTLEGGTARLVVEDDGVGTDEASAAQQVAGGHVGLLSRRVRLESAGGSLRLDPVRPHGTRAVARVPLGAG